jgi:hypothetical protein
MNQLDQMEFAINEVADSIEFQLNKFDQCLEDVADIAPSKWQWYSDKLIWRILSRKN